MLGTKITRRSAAKNQPNNDSPQNAHKKRAAWTGCLTNKLPSEMTEKFKRLKQKVPPPTLTPLHSLYKIPYGGVAKIQGEAWDITNTCSVESFNLNLLSVQNRP